MMFTIIKLFTRRRKLNISLAFITQFYFSVQKEVTKFYTLLNNEDS